MLRHEYELTPLRAETTISLFKPLSKLSKDDKVRSNEWRWSDDSTGYSSQVHISNLNQGGSDIMQRLTGFEMGHQEREILNHRRADHPSISRKPHKQTVGRSHHI